MSDDLIETNETEEIEDIKETGDIGNTEEDTGDTEDDYLAGYEEETRRRVDREARRKSMQKAKQRQLLFRKYWAFILIAILVCVTLIIVAVSGLIKHKADAARADAETVEALVVPIEDADTEEETGDSKEAENGDDSGDRTSDEDLYIDSEYGPFKELYSEEKDAFFEGYEVVEGEQVAVPSEEDVRSTYSVLIDADEGTIIEAKGADQKIYPASMTKIMTILVAAEHVTNLDDTFLIDLSITDYAYSNDCSAVGFALGETVTVRDLMYGTILPSGADAAVALAEYVAGSEDRFVEMMNDKLEELGLSDTAHFTNCIGIYDDENYCTITDMAMILKAAVENDLARQILNAHKYTTSRTTEHPDGIEISNWFLRRIEDKETGGEVMCAKTGFVAESGSCAASYQLSDSGKHYICVTADAWSSWRCIYDHVALYSEYGK